MSCKKEVRVGKYTIRIPYTFNFLFKMLAIHFELVFDDDGWNDCNKFVSVGPAQYIAVQLCRGTGRILGNSIVALCRQMSQTDVAMSRTWCGTLVTKNHYFSGAQLPEAVGAGTGTSGTFGRRIRSCNTHDSWIEKAPKVSQTIPTWHLPNVFSPLACGKKRKRRMKFGPLIS
jgi:hypothetical protein